MFNSQFEARVRKAKAKLARWIAATMPENERDPMPDLAERGCDALPMGVFGISGRAADLFAKKTDMDKVLEGIARHALRDWGDMSVTDGLINDHAVTAGKLTVSMHRAPAAPFYVVRSGDGATTTVYTEDEYRS